MRVGIGLGVFAIALVSCKPRNFNEKKAEVKQTATVLQVNPLDLSFHLPFPSVTETYKLPVDDDLIPRQYYDEFFPQRWFEYHAWLFDKTADGIAIRKGMASTDATEQETGSKLNEKLMAKINNDANALKDLKEEIWKHLFVTAVRFEPCFPAMPVADKPKDFMACGLHALFLVAQVIVDGKAYGTANTLNVLPKQKQPQVVDKKGKTILVAVDSVIDALKDFRKLGEDAGVDTKGAIYIHPAFSSPKAATFFSSMETVFKKYVGKKTLFGSAFSAKTTQYNPNGKVEIWNLNANAAPIKTKPGQTEFPGYARTTDQLLIIESFKDGKTKADYDLNPPQVGKLGPSVWESDFGPGLEKAPKLKQVFDLAAVAHGSASKSMLDQANENDDPSVTAINKENCGVCHLSAAARYRKMPDSKADPFFYGEPNAPEKFPSAEEAMAPSILALYKAQETNKTWLPYHHGYANGTDQPIVSPRHINEMFAVTKMVNLKEIK